MQNTNKFEEFVSKTTKIMNYIACGGIVAVMMLVVLNIILRAVFNKPILGTYEYTCFLTTVVIGCSIAFCALNDGHISINYVMEKIQRRKQNIVRIITNAVSLFFIGILTWSLFAYAQKLWSNGELSLTTQTPFYIFVYITAVGFIMFCLVILVKMIRAVKGVISK